MKKENISKYAVWVLVYVALVSVGFVCGILTFTFNETKLTEEIRDEVVPALNETLAENTPEQKTISYAPIDCFVNSTHLNYTCVNK